jgi:coenzyme PQQ precursor peptide PqqA
MQWSKPEFQEITLNMEVTAYVNTDDAVGKPSESRPQAEPISSAAGNAVPKKE